jgi:hypothetical protein
MSSDGPESGLHVNARIWQAVHTFMSQQQPPLGRVGLARR